MESNRQPAAAPTLLTSIHLLQPQTKWKSIHFSKTKPLIHGGDQEILLMQDYEPSLLCINCFKEIPHRELSKHQTRCVSFLETTTSCSKEVCEAYIKKFRLHIEKTIHSVPSQDKPTYSYILLVCRSIQGQVDSQSLKSTNQQLTNYFRCYNGSKSTKEYLRRLLSLSSEKERLLSQAQRKEDRVQAIKQKIQRVKRLQVKRPSQGALLRINLDAIGAFQKELCSLRVPSLLSDTEAANSIEGCDNGFNEESKSRKHMFYQACLHLKQRYPSGHPVYAISTAKLFEQATELNVPQSHWGAFLRKTIDCTVKNGATRTERRSQKGRKRIRMFELIKEDQRQAFIKYYS